MRNKPQIREIKRTARDFITDRHAFLAGLTLLLNLLNLLLNYLVLAAIPLSGNLFGIILYFAASVVVNIVYYILLAGLYGIYLNLCRGRQYRMRDLFSAFTYRPEPIAVYSLVQYVLTLILTTLLQWYFNRVIQYLYYGTSGGLLTGLPVLLLVLIVFIWIQISLSMVLFLYNDYPNLSAIQLMRESQLIMTGVKGRFIHLDLSFLGLYFLGLLSFGIGLLFINPYRNTSHAIFYEKLADCRQSDL